jgi:hypothetical protein
MTEHNQMNRFEENPQADNMSGVRQQAGQAVSGATSKVKETVKETAEAVTEQAKQRLNQATGTTKEELTNVTEQVRQQADSMISEQKGMAADRLGSLATTLRQTSRQLQDQEEGTMGRYAEIVADQIEMASDFLRTRDTGDLIGEVQRLARRSPEAFVAGSLAVGFLLGRFIKGPSRSGQRTQQGYQGQGYQGSSYGQGVYQSGYQSGGYQGSAYGASQGWQRDQYTSGGQGMYRGSDNPAEGVVGSGEAVDNQSSAYQGRFESSGIQGNAYQQGGFENRGYQAEGADDVDIDRNYEGGSNAYQTGPDITEGSDTDYPRYDPSYAAGGAVPEANTAMEDVNGDMGDESTSEGSSYNPSSRR